jgi:hypothetical protein
MPSTPQAADKPAQHRISRNVRTALEAMVWQGLRRREAAQVAGIADHTMYQAMRTPPVKAAYADMLQVLRESEKARNIHALVEVRDQQVNQMARVNAVKALEQLDETASATAGPQRQQPGLVIVIQGGEQGASVGTNVGTLDLEAKRLAISTDDGG